MALERTVTFGEKAMILKVITKRVSYFLLTFILLSNLNLAFSAPESLKSEMELKLLGFIGIIASEKEQGNKEASFLYSIIQYVISNDKSDLVSSTPANAAQAFLLSGFYLNEKDYQKAIYWIDVSRLLLKNQTSMIRYLPSTNREDATSKTYGSKVLVFIGDLSNQAQQGNQEADFLLKIIKYSVNSDKAILQSLNPHTSTEAYIAASSLLSANDSQSALYYIDKAKELLSTKSLSPLVDYSSPNSNHISNYQTDNQSLQNEHSEIEVSNQLLALNSPIQEDITENESKFEVLPDSQSQQFIIPEEELLEIESLATQNNNISTDIDYLLKGIRYYMGRGVPRNYSTSAKYLLKAAELGNGMAQVCIAYMYKQGEGVPQNYTLAREWYEKSIHNGIHWGYNNLGLMYKEGLGAPKDLIKAEKLFKLAISHNTGKESSFNLGALYFQQKRYTEAETYLQKALSLGITDAYSALATLYDAQKKYSLSYQYWKKSALKGEPLGFYNMAVSYVNGDGVTKSYVKAYYCACISAKKGYRNANTLINSLRSRLNPSQLNHLNALLQRSGIQSEFI